MTLLTEIRVDLPFLRKGVNMTHLAEEGDLIPFIEWVDNPPFHREKVTSTLLTEIKGVIKSQRKSQRLTWFKRSRRPAFPQEVSRDDSPHR